MSAVIDTRPTSRPANPRFSSGPCPKRPGWTPDVLAAAMLGRSHRSAAGIGRLRELIDLTRAVLEIPPGHRLAIVPGSDTGAIEMALWCLLGQRRVTVLAWEAFGKAWATDIVDALKLRDSVIHAAPYGDLPDLARVDFDSDVVFTWNGTAAGVKVPSGAFIPDDRTGLTICDATSAAFAQPLDWDKLDVATFSWQKCLGGEAAHGMLVLGPRAIARLERFTPNRAIPKLFRLTAGAGLLDGLFEGWTINTPSMLCVEDCLDALRWARGIGGLATLRARADANAKALADWVAATPWVEHLARDPATRSNTSVCLRIVDPALTDGDGGVAFVAELVARLETEGVAYDIGAYRDAPPGLRIWCGPTVETADLAALTPWLDWAHGQVTRARGIEPR